MKKIIVLLVCLTLLTPSSDFLETSIPMYVNISLLIVLGIAYILSNKNAFVSRKDIKIVWPLLAMTFIVAISHVKGIVLGFQIDISDFSEYLKFLIPLMLYIVVLSFLRSNNEKLLMSSLWFIVFLYSILFLAYLFLGSSFIYSLGLGRGPAEYYRYAGIDMNPNAYAAISVGLFFLLVPDFLQKKRLIKVLILVLMLLSVLFSQSRTTLAFLILSLSLYFLTSKSRIYYKFLFIALGAIGLFYIFFYYDLYWLTTDNRLDIENDRSFGTRRYNSTLQYNLYEKYIGLFGVGPAKAEINRLDTITYIIYYLRYGILGVLCFVYIHFNFSIQMYRKLIRSRVYKYKNSYEYLLVSIIFPFYILGVNISNEKWIDIKFLLIWMIMLALASYKYEQSYNHG